MTNLQKAAAAQKKAFTKSEREAFKHLGLAVAAFSKLKMSHPSHQKDFTDGIHACQGVLGQRVLQREHPYVFATYAHSWVGDADWWRAFPAEMLSDEKATWSGCKNPLFE